MSLLLQKPSSFTSFFAVICYQFTTYICMFTQRSHSISHATVPRPADRPIQPPVHQVPGTISQRRSGHGIQLTAYLHIVLRVTKDCSYCSYQNIWQEFFPNLTSWENWGGYLIITHKVEHVLYRHFPGNWTLWIGGHCICRVILFLSKYSIFPCTSSPTQSLINWTQGKLTFTLHEPNMNPT
jgi:hypothetical protein